MFNENVPHSSRKPRDYPLNNGAVAGFVFGFGGVIVLREKTQRMKTRIKREIKRLDYRRFLDVLAFRLYYKFFLAEKDKTWHTETLKKFGGSFLRLRKFLIDKKTGN